MPLLPFPQNQGLRASLLMILAMAAFVINDTLVKVIGPSLPLGELLTIRGIVSGLLIALIAARQGALAELPAMFNRAVFIRAALDLVATMLFIVSLYHMQIANITAILQAVPMAVTLLSALLLGEKVGWHRATAIAAGFAGVLLIVKPNPQTFSLYEALALVIVFAVALRDLATRRIPTRIPTLLVALANAWLVALGGLPLMLVEEFVMPQPWQIACLAAAAVSLALAYLLLVTALRLSDLSATAPYRYAVMLFAIISGIVVFGEFPDAVAIAGMAMIIGAGLYTMRREAVLRNTSRTPRP